MALLRVDFYSHYLERNVVLTAVIPADKMDGNQLAKKRRGPYRTVYLLHGLFGRDYDWIDKTHVVETAEARDIALIMPSGEDGLYLNKPEINEWHGKFISEELVDFTRRLFPLSAKREDTALAGISIGAYTALINGLLRPDRFGDIIILSGAGLTIRAALLKISAEMPASGPLYQALAKTTEKMEHGATDEEALDQLTVACNMPQVRRFVSVILQNMHRGGADVLVALQDIGKELWEARKAAARQIAEETSTKLLFPMMLMLIAVILLVAAPAVMGMAI